MIADEIEKLGVAPLKQYMGDIPWPSSEATIAWEKIVHHGRRQGILSGAFLNVFVDVDLGDAKRYSLYVDQVDGSLPLEIYLDGIDDPVVQAYLKLMEWMMQRFSPDATNIKELAREIVELEIELAKISETKEERRDLTQSFRYVNIGELEEALDYLNWTQYFNYIFPEQVHHLTGQELILGGVDYFKRLAGVLDKTPKRTLQNYAAWTLIVEASAMLSQDFRDQLYQMEKASYGVEKEEERWKECTSAALTLLPSVVGSMYVRKFFSDEAKQKVEEITMNIIKEFNSILGEVDWMDNKTRAAALKKVEYLNHYVGYADELMNDTLLATYYAKISTPNPKSTFFNLVLQVSNFSIFETFNLLNQTVDRRDWRFIQTPATANAFYLATHNHIELSAGILQGDVFSSIRPDLFNYATIGMIIGHEVSHAFDDQGSQFDASGSLRNWWEEDTHLKYLDKAKCFVEQYGNFTEGETKVQGRNTQGENVADHGGTSASYRAYKKHARDGEVKLDGLDFTTDQLFWISAAQMWCTNRRKGKRLF